jgi:hypothetical protein
MPVQLFFDFALEAANHRRARKEKKIAGRVSYHPGFLRHRSAKPSFLACVVERSPTAVADLLADCKRSRREGVPGVEVESGKGRGEKKNDSAEIHRGGVKAGLTIMLCPGN